MKNTNNKTKKIALLVATLAVPSVVSGATIIGTDFTGATVDETTMSNISWDTSGIVAPASTLSVVHVGTINSGDGNLLATDPDAVGVFAPDNNTGNGGEWNTTIAFATLADDILLGNLAIDWINFGGNALRQTVERNNVFNIQILDVDNGGASLFNVSQTTTTANSSVTPPTETFNLSSVTLSGGTNYQLVISALDAPIAGSHTAIDALVLEGTVIVVPEPSSTLLLGFGSLALLTRRKK